MDSAICNKIMKNNDCHIFIKIKMNRINGRDSIECMWLSIDSAHEFYYKDGMISSGQALGNLEE